MYFEFNKYITQFYINYQGILFAIEENSINKLYTTNIAQRRFRQRKEDVELYHGASIFNKRFTDKERKGVTKRRWLIVTNYSYDFHNK